MCRSRLRKLGISLERSASAVLVPLVFAGSVRVAAAQSQNADSALNACLATDTTTGWQGVASAWADESGLTWSNDPLRQRLLRLAERDQSVRQAGQLADSLDTADFRRRMRVVDSTNATALRDIIDRFGWPTKSMVGPKGASAAFLIAQHNERLQHEVLALMQALPPGEVAPGERAMLEDRVRVRDGLPQRYGTQLTWDSTGVMRFDPIEDLDHLDARRVEVGLPPIPVYICMMRAVYGRQVAWPPDSHPER